MDLKDIPTIDPHPVHKPLEPGEYYAAQRNGPAIIGICRKHDQDIGCVFPEIFGIRPEGGGLSVIYPYDTRECYRISKETYDKMAQQVNTAHKEWLVGVCRKSPVKA